MIPGTADVAVVGGGLSGLAVAEALARSGRDVHVLEARGRVGGRVLSLQAGAGRFDLGPAWIWPENRRVLALAERFGLSVHTQHSAGTLVFEDGTGQIQRDLSFSMMGNALRLAGGLGRLAEALAAQLPGEAVHLSHRVAEVSVTDGAVTLAGLSADGAFHMQARHAVLALPPRLIAERLAFYPPMGPAAASALRRVPTWMAGHAKVVALYSAPFWRAAGQSGDAISHRGPLVEIHDATDENAGAAALFGFASPARTWADEAALREAAVAQLTRLFGPEAGAPTEVLVKDWLQDPDTATAADRDLPAGHPSYGLPMSLAEWAGPRLHLAGTEVASQNGGFLEGALEAAEAVLTRLPVPA